MCTSDDKGLVEPNSDLVAMVLAVIGFVLFVSLVAHTYQVYQEKTNIAEHYHDAATLSKQLMTNPVLTVPDRPDLIDASRIESLTPEDISKLEKLYGNRYDFSFKIQVPPAYIAVVGTSEDMGVSASVPVTVKLNDVNEMPGTLTVKIWER